MRPSIRARYRTENGSSTIAARSSRSGGGGRRRELGDQPTEGGDELVGHLGRDLDLGGHDGPTLSYGRVRVPRMSVATHPARRLGAVLEPVAAQVYFAPECHKGYTALGFDDSAREVNGVAMPDGPAYFTSRGSILGQVPGDVVAAAFGVFNPEVVVPCVELGWSRTDAPTIGAARTEGATEQLRRVLGDEPDGLDRVNELLARAVEPLRPEGRSLYAGLRALDVPDDPLAAMWRRCDMLREFRGDSHIASWVSAGLDATEIGLLTELFWGLPLRSLQPDESVDDRAVRRRHGTSRVPRARRRRRLHAGRSGAPRGHRSPHRHPDEPDPRRARRRTDRALRRVSRHGARRSGRPRDTQHQVPTTWRGPRPARRATS